MIVSSDTRNNTKDKKYPSDSKGKNPTTKKAAWDQAAGEAKLKIWKQKTINPVFCIPFVEGVPTKQSILELERWAQKLLSQHRHPMVILYHGTAPGTADEILRTGLKKTSATRRRSYQSKSGRSYLAVTPARAEAFGRMGNSNCCLVLEITVSLRHLRPDTDQIQNLMGARPPQGVVSKNTVGFSFGLAGTAACIKVIEPWAIQPIQNPYEPNHP
jgi:hypothetical protein